jgi:hypothetical protein
MTAATERGRRIPVQDMVDHMKARLAVWDVPDADVLWAIQKGAPLANSTRSKRLMAVAQYGGSRLVPFEDVWVVKGNSVILDALRVLEAELIANAEIAADRYDGEL